MAEIELFHYRRGKGILHRLDGRFKLLEMIILTLSIFKSAVPSLILITLFTILVFLMEYFQSKILSPFTFLENTRGFLLFLILIAVIRGLTAENTYLSGLLEGAFYSWKLLLLIIWGQLLSSTTAPSDIHGSVYRILYRIPLINGGIIATMISLTLSFIPLLFDQYLEIQNAVQSRLGNFTKNPLKKIAFIALPLLQSTIRRADEIAQAMESRCYSDNPTLPSMKIHKKDWISLGILGIISLSVFLLNN
jgi:energy-coupling factor transporter transmembrane protein EcfT